MKATEAKLLDFLKKSSQFEIPIYQRTYSWTEKECRQLWEDIVRCGSNDEIAVHFVGSIVYIERGLSQVTHHSPLLVIDGQQRLTTVTLLLAALAELVVDEEPFDGFSQRKITNYYLVNPEEKDERHFKLILSQTDKDSLKAIVGCKELPKEHSLRVKENHELFKEWLLKPGTDLVTICKGLVKLVVVDIALNRDQDNPQLIFESMNSTGKELSQADLIRNFILMGLETELQTTLYEEYWRPIELDFGQEAYGTHFDAFMRHYLTMKTGEIPNKNEVYDAFKKYSRLIKPTPDEGRTIMEILVCDIRQFAGYFCRMALVTESDTDLKKAFRDLRELKVDVTYPFLLELYEDHAQAVLSEVDFASIIRLVESYVFRRAICSIPTNSMNKTFSTFNKSLKKDRYLESIQAHFLLLPSYRRFPRNEEFHRELQTRDLYNFRSRSYWLRRFENFERKEFVAVNEYTTEHIMPQNEKLNEAWQVELGENYQEIQGKWLHTLGNLTLTGYNSEYSDRPFREKRDMKGGFKDSPLKVNKMLGQLGQWNEITIQERAARLADHALRIWEEPMLNDEKMAPYLPQKAANETYSIENHPNLLNPNIQPLFETFRREVTALDPCVTEEFLKLYVAYKAETNFVDVVPQASQLKLTLNMNFSDLHDPKVICKDVTGLGRWGNGNVEVGFSSQEELPYILGLVRQSLELQLGNEHEP